MTIMTLTDELIRCGIKENSSIIHFGAGHKNGQFLVDMYNSFKSNSISPNYVGVEAEESKVKSTIDLLLKNEVPSVYQNITNIAMQDYIVDNNHQYDHAIITGIFDKSLYGETQFQFIHSIINELFKFVNESVLFTYNSSDHQEETYNIHYMNGYVQSNYSRYSVVRINEHEYLYCINKYYLPYNNI